MSIGNGFYQRRDESDEEFKNRVKLSLNTDEHGLIAGKEQAYNIDDLVNLEGVKGKYKDLTGSYRVVSVEKDSFTIERNECSP